MNESSASSQPGSSLLPDATGAITTAHLILIALVAIAALAILIVGARKRRVRRHARHEVARHAEEAGVAAPGTDDAPPAAPMPPAAPTPAPAPLMPPVDRPSATSDIVAPLPSQPPETGRLADEPIAAAAPMEATPASEAASPVEAGEAASPIEAGGTGGATAPADAETPAAATGSPADGPVTQLKGLGPKVSAKLAELGITTVGQLARLDEDEAAALDAQLGAFRGRMGRDRWIEQARFLAAGDRAGFEAVFGKL